MLYNIQYQNLAGYPASGFKTAQKFLRANPVNHNVRRALVNALIHYREYRQAETHVTRLCADNPSDHVSQVLMITCKMGQGAIETGTQQLLALAQDREHEDFVVRIALTLIKFEQYYAADTLLAKRTAVLGVSLTIMINRGVCAFFRGFFDQAIEFFTQARTVAQARKSSYFHKVSFDLADAHIHKENYAQAWPFLEHRRYIPTLRRMWENLDIPYWRGENLANKNLIVLGEQGLGDNLFAARLLPLLQSVKAATRPAKVIVVVYASMCNILRRSFPDPFFEFVPMKKFKDLRAFTEQDASYHTLIMSLCGYFDITAQIAPNPKGLLKVDASRVSLWHSRINELCQDPGKKRVGITWYSPYRFMGSSVLDPMKSINLEALFPLKWEQDIQIFAIQLDQPEQVKALVDETGAIDCAPWIEDFDDTAALYQTMDAIITLDSSTLHLAGNLDIPTFCAVCKHADWRVAMKEGYLLWYPHVRGFKQTKHRDWVPVITEIRFALR
ncbi:MAG: tetratricopeptide repeat protein, partial [Pseudomonadota bacterium]